MKPFLLLIATRFSLGRRIKTCRNLICHPIVESCWALLPHAGGMCGVPGT